MRRPSRSTSSASRSGRRGGRVGGSVRHTIPDSNPGELMKWLPGVSVEYFANNIVGVSVRGLDAVNTEIRFDGMPQASASTATLGTVRAIAISR